MGRRRKNSFQTKENQVDSRENHDNQRAVAGCSNDEDHETTKRNQVDSRENHDNQRAVAGCSNDEDHFPEPSSSCVSSDSDDSEEFCTITATALHGKWVSLLKLDIMGIQFEAVMSSASDCSVLSSRVYDLIEKKSNGEVRYKLRQVSPSTRVRDNFRQEIKLLGAVLVPCTIFGDCGKKSVTKEITFLVVEGGEIDGVVGMSAFSDDVWDLVNAVLKKPARFPLILGRENNQKRNQSESSTQSDTVFVSTIVGKKEFPKAALKHTRIPNLDGTGTVETDVLICEDTVVELLHGASSITDNYVKSMRANGRSSQTKEASAPPDRIVTILPMSSEKYPSMVKMKIANVPFEGVLSIGSGGTILSSRIHRLIMALSQDRTYNLQKTSGIMVCDIAGNEMKLLGTLRVPCTFFSARGTNSVIEPQITFLVVDGAAVDCVFGEPEIFSCQISIFLHQFLLVFNNHPSPIPIAMVGAKEDPDVVFNKELERMKNLSTNRHVSPVRNNHTSPIPIAMVGAKEDPDVVFNKELERMKNLFINRHLSPVRNNHPSPIPIAMVGVKEDPDVVFNKEQERMKNLSINRHVSPVKIVTVTIMTCTGKFPYMLKMDIVGIPFEVVLSTGSSGTVLSAEVYNRIARKTKDPRYNLQKATNVEVRCTTRIPMKLLGILNAPCRFISARGKNSVIEMMEFLVVEELITDGVLGMPEISSCNMGLRFEKGNSAVLFRNYEPIIEIAILEN